MWVRAVVERSRAWRELCRDMTGPRNDGSELRCSGVVEVQTHGGLVVSCHFWLESGLSWVYEAAVVWRAGSESAGAVFEGWSIFLSAACRSMLELAGLGRVPPSRISAVRRTAAR